MSTLGRLQQDAKVRTTPQAVSAYFQAPQGATISTTGGTKTVATSTAPRTNRKARSTDSASAVKARNLDRRGTV